MIQNKPSIHLISVKILNPTKQVKEKCHVQNKN